MSLCTGRGTLDGDHCCYVNGVACPFLSVGGEERNFECSLRRDLGSWEAVHADPGYQEQVQAHWDKVGVASCGSWQPRAGQCCREEPSDE